MTPVPLDPNEGPTLWLSDNDSNGHTFELIIGTDPDEPTTTVPVSRQEIERMYESIN